MKTVNSATFLVMIIFLFFSSCSDETIVDSLDKKDNIKRLEKISLDSLKSEIDISKSNDPVMGIDAYPCGVKDVTIWALDHYEAYSSVIVGIWPHNALMQNSNEISKLKNKYGFNYILFASAYDITKFNLVLSS